jgi:hypothetical protein
MSLHLTHEDLLPTLCQEFFCVNEIQQRTEKIKNPYPHKLSFKSSKANNKQYK